MKKYHFDTIAIRFGGRWINVANVAKELGVTMAEALRFIRQWIPGEAQDLDAVETIADDTDDE